MSDLHKELKKAREASLARQLTEARQGVREELSTGSNSLELVASKAGVSYINDSRATFMDATLRSLGSVEIPIVWVLSTQLQIPEEGWFVDMIKNKVRSVVLYGKDGERSLTAMRRILNYPYHSDDLRTSVFIARELAAKDETVLFSPGCPSSLDGYANYEERGATFRRAVNDL